MPAYPYRKHRARRQPRTWADSRLETWQPPSTIRRDLVGGAVLGLACVGLAWVIVNVAGMLS